MEGALFVKAKHWKKLGSTEVLNHPRIQIVEDTVELPDGKITTYIRHAPIKVHSVASIAINDKQEMLIQKEYSYPPNQIMWQLPGGGTREGEDIITAANRELSEESGYIGTTCKEIGSFYIDNRRSDMKQYVVLCTNL
jgi:8-oxo-dGTP pyrophosphatase MutT (NUDIX family)